MNNIITEGFIVLFFVSVFLSYSVFIQWFINLFINFNCSYYQYDEHLVSNHNETVMYVFSLFITTHTPVVKIIDKYTLKHKNKTSVYLEMFPVC